MDLIMIPFSIIADNAYFDNTWSLLTYVLMKFKALRISLVLLLLLVLVNTFVASLILLIEK